MTRFAPIADPAYPGARTPLESPVPLQRAGGPAANVPLTKLRFDELMVRMPRVRRFAGWALFVGAVASTAWVVLSSQDFMLAYLAIIVPAAIAIRFWWTSTPNRLPIFPMIVAQQAVLFGLPIVRNADSLKEYPLDVTTTSAMLYALFCGAMFIAWQVARHGAPGGPSRYGFRVPTGRSAAHLQSIGMILMSLALASVIFRYAFPAIFFSRAFQKIYPVYRACTSAAELGGAFVGALALGYGRPDRGKAMAYWTMIATLALLNMANLLLSGAMSVVLSAIVGTTAGRGRIPWMLLGITFGVVSFLHVGKSEMRKKYLDPKTNIDRRSLANRTFGLPFFYMDWCETSYDRLFGDRLRFRRNDADTDDFLARFDNLQNSNAVVRAINSGTPLFGGRSYAMIPMLMVPRFIWWEKPRTHEAQVQFNLHFGRQKNVKETLTTYIAVGLVTEAVGNFGFFFGPIFIGSVLGFAAGWLERISARKQPISLEGLLLFAVTSSLALAFEMSAAVLITSLSQIAFGVIAGYCMLQMLQPNSPEPVRLQ